MFSYTVVCTFDDARVAEEWITWLRDEHLAEVCAAGAMDAEVIRCDGLAGHARCEVRYHFASREAFEAYQRDHAPRLRAEGLKRFPPERGLKYERTTGEVVVTCLATGD
jgi:hypothetical protein